MVQHAILSKCLLESWNEQMNASSPAEAKATEPQRPLAAQPQSLSWAYLGTLHFSSAFGKSWASSNVETAGTFVSIPKG